MKIKKQQAALITASALALVYLISFLLYYLSSYVFISVTLSFIYTYFTEITAALTPPIAAMLMFLFYSEKGISAALIFGAVYSSLSIIYRFPLSMFGYAYDGYEISEVILISLTDTIIRLVFRFALYMLMFAVVLFSVRIFSSKKSNSISDAMKSTEPFELSAPLAKGVFFCGAIIFIYKLIIEIIDTVKFLINYSESFTAGEILFIAFRYIFLLALLLITQVSVFIIKSIFTVRES